MGRRQRLEFKASWAIRAAVAGALAVWLGVGVLAVMLAVSPGHLVAVAFFLLFFAGFAAHYGAMRYVLDEHGVTVRGATERQHYRWEDILQVQASALPLGGVLVFTRTGVFVLSTFVGNRKLLMDTIVARAGLFPQLSRS
ncbi:MAG TPA: hypothetical protein RMG48_06210 [Myxococcales bacterium LLY-WYZ-16_1]|jgi:hypothetical protein|nr:hypothetical protein [Myxococcales bacterium LLY-WYZ-16_1]